MAVEEPYQFTAYGPPRAKDRARTTRNRGTYTPKKTAEAQDALRSQYQGPCFVGPVRVTITYAFDRQLIAIEPLDAELRSPMRGDLDNYTKLTLDALNEVAWADDKQVYELHVFKAISSEP